MFVPGYVDSMDNNPEHPFRQCMRENDVYDWHNPVPTTMYYCATDTVVDPENSHLALASQRNNTPQLQNQINIKDCGGFDHFNCGLPVLLYARDSFNSLRQECKKKKCKRK